MADWGPPPSPYQQDHFYRVFTPETDTVALDPLDSAKRYHEGIFVEINPQSHEGTQFHVTGKIIAASGMRYEEKENFIPGVSDGAHLHKVTQVGWISKADFHGRVSSILRALPTPPKQQGLIFCEKDPVTGRYEIIWTKEDGERYGPDEQRRPVFKCNEWTHQYAIPALRNAGVLRDVA